MFDQKSYVVASTNETGCVYIVVEDLAEKAASRGFVHILFHLKDPVEKFYRACLGQGKYIFEVDGGLYWRETTIEECIQELLCE